VNIIGIVVNCYQAFNVLESGVSYFPVSLVTDDNKWVICLMASAMLGQLLLSSYWLLDKLVSSIPQLVLDGMKIQASRMVSGFLLDSLSLTDSFPPYLLGGDHEGNVCSTLFKQLFING
jgi:hypothetical protein